jgi:hypothetical protein
LISLDPRALLRRGEPVRRNRLQYNGIRRIRATANRGLSSLFTEL